MTTPSGHQAPMQAVSGATQDTTEEAPSAFPPFMDHGAPTADPGEALRNPFVAEINRLHSFLATRFPKELTRSNTVHGESPVDIAIRLLRGLGSTGAGPRCAQEYCNLPSGHDGDHGYVHYQAR